jgi:DNA topoisomerase-3
MEHGRLQREAFMAEIAKMAERIVQKAKEYDRDTIPGDYATLATPCPNCGGVVKENYRRYTCTGAAGTEGSGCGFSITKIPGRPQLRAGRGRKPAARQEDRSAGRLPLQGRLAVQRRVEAGARRRHRQLEAGIRLRRRRQARGRIGEPVDFSGQQSLGACPKCKGHVYEHGSNYVCEHAVGAHVTCDFKTGKIILQQPVSHEQMTKLLASGKTDLLDGFVSNKTRRKFKAYLVYDAKAGKVGFEFEPRPARGAAPAKTAAAKKAAARKTA